MSNRVLAILLLLLSCAVVCSGCGGGSSSATSKQASAPGSLQFEIVWPTPTRVIPAAAQSLVIQVMGGSSTSLKKVIPRPPAGTNTSAVRFDALAPGVVTVTVEAFPNPDGTGVVQAIGSTTVAIISGITTQATIDPSSTVDHIDLEPQPLVLIPNRPMQLTVSPRNSADALVLVAPSSLQWSTETPGVATVDGGGLVTGVTLGDTRVRVVDSESGQSASTDVHVVPPVVIDPAQATVSIGDTVQFSATVTGLTPTDVTWSVIETNGGSIDSSGLYVAPGQSGTFHIRATSTADTTISATATIVVQSGSGTINVQ